METEKKSFIEKYGQIIVDASKAIFLAIITILLFLYIQKPEFLLNKNKTKSELAREQAKLFIDLLN